MIYCLQPFHTTCKSCYNLFHGFVDRQRVTVWSSGCALEHFLCMLHSTGVAVWVRVCFGLRLLWVCLGLGLVRFGFVLGWTWFDWACFGWDLVLCFRSRYKLISRAWAKSSVLRNCTQTLVIENTATLYRHNEKTQLDQVSSWTCMLSDLHLRSASLPITSAQQSKQTYKVIKGFVVQARVLDCSHKLYCAGVSVPIWLKAPGATACHTEPPPGSSEAAPNTQQSRGTISY